MSTNRLVLQAESHLVSSSHNNPNKVISQVEKDDYEILNYVANNQNLHNSVSAINDITQIGVFAESYIGKIS